MNCTYGAVSCKKMTCTFLHYIASIYYCASQSYEWLASLCFKQTIFYTETFRQIVVAINGMKHAVFLYTSSNANEKKTNPGLLHCITLETHTHTQGDQTVDWKTQWCLEVGGTPQRLSVIKVERDLKRPYCGFILFFHEGSIPPKLDKRILMGRLMDCD